MCADACNQAERSALGTVQYTFRRESVNPYPMEGGGGGGQQVNIYLASRWGRFYYSNSNF